MRPPIGHRCQRCGASCTGSRVVPIDHDEAARIRTLAAALGIPSPLADGALRQNMGRCCFWAADAGCRLHETHGADAKPRVCRQFPIVRAGNRVAIDPACPHHQATGPAIHGTLLGTASARSLPVATTLVALAAHVGLNSAELADRWSALPWVPWTEVAALGPHLRQAVTELRAVRPGPIVPWPEGARAVATCWELQLGGSLEELVLGACVIAHAPADHQRRLLAAWVKLIR